MENIFHIIQVERYNLEENILLERKMGFGEIIPTKQNLSQELNIQKAKKQGKQ